MKRSRGELGSEGWEKKRWGIIASACGSEEANGRLIPYLVWLFSVGLAGRPQEREFGGGGENHPLEWGYWSTRQEALGREGVLLVDRLEAEKAPAGGEGLLTGALPPAGCKRCSKGARMAETRGGGSRVGKVRGGPPSTHVCVCV